MTRPCKHCGDLIEFRKDAEGIYHPCNPTTGHRHWCLKHKTDHALRYIGADA